jgi:hypothetical protein
MSVKLLHLRTGNNAGGRSMPHHLRPAVLSFIGKSAVPATGSGEKSRVFVGKGPGID